MSLPNDWRTRLARWLLRNTQYDVFDAHQIQGVRNVALALQKFSAESGHLTRAYHAGFRVQSFARNLLYFLNGAQ